jgi:hypothetical protein
MKSWGLFFAGVFVGIIVMAFIDILKISSDGPDKNETEIVDEKDDGVTMFDEPGEIFSETSFRVFQVLEKGAALVSGNTKYGTYGGINCLLINREGKLYYDDEIVKVPQGKVAKQVGVYQYPNREDMIKTVPIIMIMDK